MPHLLKHRYKILRVLSDEGGFGQTFLAEVTDTPSRRCCVIKKLRPVADPEGFKLAQERFQREAAILERLGDASDRIPKLYAYFVEEQEFYLVQELVEGPTLRQMVRQGGPLGEETVGALLVDLLSVLAYVHEHKVIHRDVKPDNVIVRRRDGKPVLIDFGIVKEVLREGGDGLPSCSVIVGTPGYISSEQAAGRTAFASDLYSLGATGLFLLTGKNPRWMADPATGKIQWRQHAPATSSAFAAVIDKATEPDIRDRYQTAGQMREDLRRALGAGAPVAAPPPAAVEEETVVRPAAFHPPAHERRRPTYALYMGVAAAVLGLLGVIGSAAVLTRLDVLGGAGSTTAEGDAPSSRPSSPGDKPRQAPANKAAATEATRTRTRATPVTQTHVTHAPTGGEHTSSETAKARGRFPEASLRLLTERDLGSKSPWELRVMRNEIYARHGYIFQTPEMRGYFARQHWYRPRYDDVSAFLSDVEIENASKIRSTE